MDLPKHTVSIIIYQPELLGSYQFIRSQQFNCYNESDGIMVGRKYSYSSPRSPCFLLSVCTPWKLSTSEVGEVVCSQAKNKTKISTTYRELCWTVLEKKIRSVNTRPIYSIVLEKKQLQNYIYYLNTILLT